MAFWTDPANIIPKQSHRWELVLTAGRGNTNNRSLPPFIVKSCERPSFEIGSVQAKYLYSNTINFPKRLSWKPIKIELYDVYMNDFTYTLNIPFNETDSYQEAQKTKFSTVSFINYILKNSGYHTFYSDQETSLDKNINWKKNLTYKTYSFKQNLVESLRKIYVFQGTEQKDTITSYGLVLREIDSFGNTIDEWAIYNPLITNVSFSKLDYSSDAALSVTLDIVYDFAEIFNDRGYKAVNYKKTMPDNRETTPSAAPAPVVTPPSASAPVVTPPSASAPVVTPPAAPAPVVATTQNILSTEEKYIKVSQLTGVNPSNLKELIKISQKPGDNTQEMQAYVEKTKREFNQQIAIIGKRASRKP